MSVPQYAEIIPFPQGRRARTHEPWVSEDKVAAYYDVSTRTVRRWKRKGCPSEMKGGQRRYRLGEVDRWHDAQQEEGPSS